MKIQYTQTQNLATTKAYQIFDGKNYVGSVEGAGNIDGEFISVIIIDPNYHGKGVGFNAFKMMFNEINKNYPISKIIGSWHKNDEYKDFEKEMSTNLKTFYENLQTHSDVESALKTPTGKWAKKLGFGNCEVKSKSNNEVIVNFTK